MRLVTAAIVALVLALLSPGVFFAQSVQSSATRSTSVPRLINISGIFHPADGQPPAHVEVVTLGVYAEQQGGAPLWQETQSIDVDAAGRYALLLGATETDGIPLDVFASGEARWLGMVWARPGEVEGPRTRLTSVPYALRASDADTLGGKPASAYVLAPTTSGKAGTSNVAGAEDPAAPIISAVLPGATNYLAKYYNTVDVGTSALYDAGGLVGINTGAPLDALHAVVNNSTGTMTGVAVQNLGNTVNSYSGMLFYDQFGALGQFQGFNNVTHEYRINNIAGTGSINFMIGNTSRLVVAPGGNVGIGTVDPNFKLTISDSGNSGLRVANRRCRRDRRLIRWLWRFPD